MLCTWLHAARVAPVVRAHTNMRTRTHARAQVGVPASNTDALGAAVRDVWASLFSRRAVLSRRAAGVGQTSATMAVLVMVRGVLGNGSVIGQ